MGKEEIHCIPKKEKVLQEKDKKIWGKSSSTWVLKYRTRK